MVFNRPLVAPLTAFGKALVAILCVICLPGNCGLSRTTACPPPTRILISTLVPFDRVQVVTLAVFDRQVVMLTALHRA